VPPEAASESFILDFELLAARRDRDLGDERAAVGVDWKV